MKMASLPHNSNRHAVQYKRPVATWPPVGVVSLVYYLHCSRTLPLLSITKIYTNASWQNNTRDAGSWARDTRPQVYAVPVTV